jgi:hypothetical protein
MADIHSTLIAEEARKILRPMGLIQRGRSRTWVDDHVWWAGVVEFQPSSFSKGSYLNVGCMWLWHVRKFIGYGVVDRVGKFHSFESEEQFRPAAVLLVHQAAQEILRLRRLFLSAGDVCAYYKNRMTDMSLWHWFDAAVVSALSGKPEQARQLFDKVINGEEPHYGWVREAQLDAKQLSALTIQPKQFREAIVERVRLARELQKLPRAQEVVF